MAERAIATDVLFTRSFRLAPLGLPPAGGYRAERIEAQLPTALSEGFGRLSTMIRIPADAGSRVTSQIADPMERAAARMRDGRPVDVGPLDRPAERGPFRAN